MPPSFLTTKLSWVHVPQKHDDPMTLSVPTHVGFHLTFIGLYSPILFLITFTLTLTQGCYVTQKCDWYSILNP